ncbi:MAG: hypothetical protein M1826_005379 [Phylliscum demangeonii]|nr:MAG: hypothetical protein M1826_005379 [Phylliscum demangeonii]
MSSGTMSDKISALTLLVQESPLHTMKAFENLVGLAKKRNRGQAINSLAALKDLLAQGEVLPPSRKLRAFSNQPQLCSALQGPQAQRWKPGQDLPGGLQPIHLVAWAFEDWLKVSYFEVIKLLEIWCSDEVEFSRTRTLVYISELLSLKPEQEANLLRLLVNKLGDPDRKIASKASYLLLQLQTAHPLMKSVIVSHIESELLFRPRQTAHAKYYAVITLNQTVLSDKDEAVAVKLLEIFFALFVALLKEPDASEPVAKTVAPGADQGKAGSQARKKQRRADAANSVGEDVKQKLISAVLTGVHRAFPYSNSDGAIIQKHLDTLFKITHSSNFNTSVQALQLLQQLSASQQTASDRFYRTLYESLLDPRLLTSSKQAMYLNVLFRSLKADVKIKRVRAFVKRLVQVLSLHQPAFACGSLYLIKELQDTVPSLHSLVDEPENYDDDEEEVFRDVADDDDDDEAGNGRPKAVVDPTGDDSRHRRSPRPRYDPRKRDPEHCHADYACLWELLPLTVHYHPSVTLFADRLLHTQAAKPPKPDLSLHTLVHFLDRFVYRNAKTNTAPRGVSLMQPLTGDTSAYGLLLSKRDTSRAQPPVNAEPFAHQKPEDVKVDEVFFHRYFSQLKRAGRAKPKRRKNDGEEDDEDEGERRPEKRRKKARASGDEGDESDDDDDDDDEVWKALVGSRPDVAGADDFDDEDDVDLDLDDLDSSDEGDDDDGDALFGSAADLVEDGSEREGGRLDEDEDEDEDEDAEAEAEPDADDTDADDAAAAAAAIHGRATASTEPSSRRGLSPPTKRSSKRRKLKHLPTFASADDYAHMLGGEDEDGDGM